MASERSKPDQANLSDLLNKWEQAESDRQKFLEQAPTPLSKEDRAKERELQGVALDALASFYAAGGTRNTVTTQDVHVPSWTEQGDIQAQAYAELAALKPIDPLAQATVDYYDRIAQYRHVQQEVNEDHRQPVDTEGKVI